MIVIIGIAPVLLFCAAMTDGKPGFWIAVGMLLVAWAVQHDHGDIS